jgi:serine/threonine protein kinase/class 3 adenylate cyclase/tetratricopeptide (TPR) repeat protein
MPSISTDLSRSKLDVQDSRGARSSGVAALAPSEEKEDQAVKILPPGTAVGKYPIVRVLSTGGMGVLYEAVHPVLGTRVVVKTVRPELAGNEAIGDRFRNEALAASRVRDDRLPQIFDVDRLADGTRYMVMEYLDGEDLSARLLGGPLAPDYAARVMVEVLEVLDRVHRLGIVHRDIKPQNVFLARSDLLGEIPKLLDFGVAHFTDRPSTRPGELMGTPLYMALEQGPSGGEVGPWTDVFAAGVVLYECLAGSGRRPWTPPSVHAWLSLLADGVPPRPLTEVAEVDPALAEVVMRAIRVRREERFPDAAAFARALEPFAADRAALFGGRSRRAAPEPAPTRVREPSRRAPDSPLTRVQGRQALATIRQRLAALRSEGEATPPARLQDGERRHLTVLCVELRLVASAESPVGPEDLDALQEQVLAVLADRLAVAGGDVHAQAGTTLLAAFGRDQTHEDDAERAVLAALTLARDREAVGEALAEVRVEACTQVGAHTGFVTLPADRAVLAGETVTVARALAARAPLNGVLASRETVQALSGRFAAREQPDAAPAGRTPGVFEILRATDGDDPEAWARTASSVPMVGRERELAVLRQWLERPRPGGTVAMGVVSGQPGMGKTRLLNELLLGATGFPALRVEPPALRPFGLWAALVRRLLHDGIDDAPGQALRRLAFSLEPASRAALLAQERVFAVLLGSGEEREDDAPEDLRDRLRFALGLAIEAAARREADAHGGRPLLVVIDNLHRADRASVDLLAPVWGAVRAPVPPLVLLGARDADLPALPADPVGDRVALGPLADDEVAALVQSLAGGLDHAPALLQVVRDRAAGNPLLAEQLTLALLEQGMARAPEARLRELAIPTTLYGLILSRVEAIEPPLREALRCASVIGARFDERLFLEVTGRLAGTPLADEATARAHLERLARRGALVAVEESPEPAWRFRLVLIRDAVYGTVLSENRRLLHRLTAEALERLYPDRLAELAPEILHHYGQTDEHARVAHYAARVGRQAYAMGAYAEAVDALSVAAGVAERLPDTDPLPAARTLLTLGRALLMGGRLAESADRLLGVVARLAGAQERDALQVLGQARMALGETLYHQARWDESEAHLLEAERVFARAGLRHEAALASCRRGFQLRDRGRPREGLAHARAGWAVLQAFDDPAAIARAGHDLGNLLRDVGEHEEALAVFDRAIAAADRLYAAGERADVHYGRLGARSGRGMTWAAMGRYAEAIADQRDVLRLAAEQKIPMAEAAAAYHLASHLAERAGPGDLDDARRLLLRSLELCREHGLPVRAMKCRLLQARIARDLGRPQEELEHLEAAEFLAREAHVETGAWIAVVEALHSALVARGERARAQGVVTGARARVHGDTPPELRQRLDTLSGSR